MSDRAALLDSLLADLHAEGDALRGLVAELDETGWRQPTPAAGWDVAAQVAHLAWTDEAAILAARAHDDPESWDALVTTAMDDPTGFVDAEALRLAALPTADLLSRWDTGRRAIGPALRDVPEGQKLPWFGPPMSPASMVTARFMETWAHSLDCHQALGVTPASTDRIKHVAHIGVRTRDFAFLGRELPPPTEEFRVELTAPSGERWTWGPADAAQRVTGTAEEFCRVVTQRLHRADTALLVDGDDADRWLDIAQAFAGPPGTGRPPRGETGQHA